MKIGGRRKKRPPLPKSSKAAAEVEKTQLDLDYTKVDCPDPR